MSCSEQCISLFLHEGQPTGTISSLDGVNVYVAQPSASLQSSKAILIYPDIYGIGLKNIQLIADRLAKDVNVPVYLIDLFDGDAAVPNSDMSLPDWFKNHGPEATLPLIEKVANRLKSQGITDFGAVGYCFGGKYVFHDAQLNRIKVGAVCHPSLLENPQDILKLKETGKVPILINSCEDDRQFPIEFQKVADEILGDGKYTPGYKRTYYPGATHGFGCRADLKNPKEKFAFDESFKEIVQWFKTHL